MSWHESLPVLVVACSLVSGAVIFFLDEGHRLARTVINLSASILKLVLVALLLAGVSGGEVYAFRYPLIEGVDFSLHADPFSLLFVTLSAALWFVTTVYAIGYLDLDGVPRRAQFFGFFSLCVSATTGIALAGNLLTFLIFYEVLTLTTYPLVVHRGSPAALRGGRLYLLYSLAGGAMLLLALVWLRSMVGSVEFVPGGMLRGASPALHPSLRVAFVLLIAGFAVKAAMVPFHSWLPEAMVAPAPVSALLHAVAVVKAGAFGILRVVYDIYGVGLCAALDLTPYLAAAASVTILYGSLRALYQENLKRRLAWSTVSQVSYIALGVALFSPLASTGGIVHLVHQGLMKITLFLAAGNFSEGLGVKSIHQMKGVGRRMPWTATAFTVGALGMVGLPPLAGFVSKWYLAMGAFDAGAHWVLGVLAASTVLNALYFLPLVHTIWFEEPAGDWPHHNVRTGRLEIGPMLLGPPVATAALTLLAGLLAGWSWSPLSWATLILSREFLP